MLGNQGTTQGNCVTGPTELRGQTEKVGGDSKDGELQRRESKGTYKCCAV